MPKPTNDLFYTDIAFGNDGKVSLWCSDLEKHDDGIHFQVKNGGWYGVYGNGFIRIRDDGHEPIKASIIWRGQVPEARRRDYSLAIEWIEADISSVKRFNEPLVELVWPILFRKPNGEIEFEEKFRAKTRRRAENHVRKLNAEQPYSVYSLGEPCRVDEDVSI